MQGLAKLFSGIPKSAYFLALLLVNIVLLALAYLFYSGAFSFWVYPLSYLGHAFSYAEGSPNGISKLLYGVCMFLSGIVMLLLGFRYKVLATKKLDWLKCLLCLIAAFGFFIASVSPNDTAHAAHVFGSSCFAFSLWFLTTVELFDIRKTLGKFKHVALQFLLHIPAIVYAITYFGNILPFSFFVQKFAVLFLIIDLGYIAHTSKVLSVSKRSRFSY